MKRIIVCVVLALLMLGSLCVIAFAEGDAPESAEVASGVLDRLFEWWETNKAEILAALSGMGAAACALISWMKSKKPFLSLISSAKTSDERERALIEGYNEMVEVVKEYNGNIKVLAEKVAELQTLVADTENIEAIIANILTTVYTNNDALPQGIKSLVSLDCAKAMTLANKDLGVEVISHDEQDEGDAS